MRILHTNIESLRTPCSTISGLHSRISDRGTSSVFDFSYLVRNFDATEVPVLSIAMEKKLRAPTICQSCDGVRCPEADAARM